MANFVDGLICVPARILCADPVCVVPCVVVVAHKNHPPSPHRTPLEKTDEDGDGQRRKTEDRRRKTDEDGRRRKKTDQDGRRSETEKTEDGPRRKTEDRLCSHLTGLVIHKIHELLSAAGGHAPHFANLSRVAATHGDRPIAGTR